MKLFHTFENLPESVRGAGVAIGNFDGLHVGHRGVIRKLRELCQSKNVPLGVLMFDPTPFNFFSPDSPSKRIMSLKRRVKILEQGGLDVAFALPFDAQMAQRTDFDFAKAVLHDGLGVSAVSVGYDFCYGKKRMGNVSTLQTYGQELGFEVLVTEKITPRNRETGAHGEELKISSTQIRALIASGDMESARLMMKDYWTIEANVVHGQKRGRTIGFPTANMYLSDYQHPKHGIYAVWTRIEGEQEWRQGVANFGRTPTTGDRDPLLEVFLFDFDGDLYGKELEVAFVEFLRPEAKFDGLAPLIAQMHKDTSKAKQILAKADKPSV